MAKIEITYNPRAAVPANTDERVAWLERHGVVPDSAVLSVDLPLRRWAELAASAGDNNPDVQISDAAIVSLTGRWGATNRIEQALAAAAVRLVRESGQVVTDLPLEMLESTLRGYQAEQRRLSQEREAEAQRARDEGEARLAREVGRLSALLSGPEEALVERGDDGRWKARSLGGPLREAEIVRIEGEVRSRAAEIATARNDAADARAVAERAAWVAAHGTPSQRARHAEDLLPDQELLDAVRSWALAPLEDRARYERIDRREVRHDDECGDPSIRCGATDSDEEGADGLTSEEYEQLEEIRRLAAQCPIPATVTAREHWCTCRNCDGTYTTRQSALVTVTFAGRPLSREYAL